MKILARHKWVTGAIITESVDKSRDTATKSYRRFTATIRGWQNWIIYEGYLKASTVNNVIKTVISIRDKIDNSNGEIFLERFSIIKQKEAIP